MASMPLLSSPFTTTTSQNPRIPSTPKFSVHSNRRLHFTPISCKSQDLQTAKPPPTSSSFEPKGTGAAAPSRGEILIERHQSKSAVAFVLKKAKKKKKAVKEKVSVSTACCYGCGALLQTEKEIDAPGYVDTETYELKKKHRQLRTILCGRCKLLSHGHMLTAVGGNGGYAGGKQFVTAEVLRKKLAHLKNEKAMIVKLVDIVDFNGSFLARIRDLAGANPIILVITKIDLLPKGTDLNCIGDWVVEATTKKKLNVISVHLTSSKSLVGIAGVISEIQKEKKGRDVYILGAANVGKSAFINSMLRMMADKDTVAAAARRYKPIQSAVPGTTLGPIQIDAFQVGKLFDTPGVHLHHRQSAVIHSGDLPLLAPQSRIRGRSFPAASGKIVDETITDLNGFSIFWGGLVRIDVEKVLPQTRLTFYGPRALQLHMIPTSEADKFYKNELGTVLTPPTGKDKAEIWPGLENLRELKIRFDDKGRPTCDISISGLGWIAVEPAGKGIEMSEKDDDYNYGELHFRVHVPKPVEIFIRSPLPVSEAGGEWYEYRELSEKEEESRPKWFY